MVQGRSGHELKQRALVIGPRTGQAFMESATAPPSSPEMEMEGCTFHLALEGGLPQFPSPSSWNLKASGVPKTWFSWPEKTLKLPRLNWCFVSNSRHGHFGLERQQSPLLLG